MKEEGGIQPPHLAPRPPELLSTPGPPLSPPTWVPATAPPWVPATHLLSCWAPAGV